MKKSYVIITLVVLALIIAWLAYLLLKPAADSQKTEDLSKNLPVEQIEVPANGASNSIGESIEPAEPLLQIISELRGLLSDVTGGNNIRGIITNNTTGEASLVQTAEGFTVSASFENLPDPQGDDYYEGWIVQKNPLTPVSTGRLTREAAGMWSNSFMTEQDLTGYTFYVLTIEPNDGDPAPADHILEGDLFPL